MEPTDTDTVQVEGDAKPKPIYQDGTAYLITAAGLAAYAETNDIRILVLLIALYAIGNVAMRITAQIIDGRNRK